MKVFILALQFLTRIPLDFKLKTDETDFAKGVVYFPVAGLIIGGFNLLVYYFTGYLLEGIFPIVCYVFANIAITGGLHLDGLADTCDGIFSSRSRERMLEIMKDSRIGTNGTIAVVIDLLLRVAILYNVTREAAFYAIILAPVISRTMLVIVMKLSRYARANGMGGLFLERQTFARTAVGSILGLIIALLIDIRIGLLSFILAVITVLVFRRYIYGKIDGMTGDTIGAANEVVELVVMAFTIIVWRYGLLCWNFI
ncbi:MAG: adenosylcobinamide-GDP ribazoletransferase [Bacillota bacterium]